MKILLVCSAGGHFKALQQLRPFWSQHDHRWVTFENPTTTAFCQETGESVIWAHSPTNRNLPNLIRNLALARRVLRQYQPDVILTTGAGVAVPFLILGKLFGSQTIFIESVTRVTSLSLSAKLALPFISVLYVHWQQLLSKYPQSQLIMSPESP
ncbi:MAG: UDP-N-acetylglucosamine--LPS N-acetylglucosamine transferase [Acaryochloridaceae cyanobacterium SU_2_1]|nr:UDP-N-acetylglucosamine--LPS N-acetylglucosamine transferase [Acaryochloridaceae cyanobacterium SU_2_1]